MTGIRVFLENSANGFDHENKVGPTACEVAIATVFLCVK